MHAEALNVACSDVLGLAWPESPGLGLFKPEARPRWWAWAWPRLRPRLPRPRPLRTKATRMTTTSASTQSTSHHHPDDTSMRNPPQPSEDPRDVTGNDEHRPDAPTELPNSPEGMRR